MRFPGLGLAGFLAFVSIWPSAAFGVDTTKITAQCFVSNSGAKGSFSATNPVTLLVNTDLFIRVFYKNDDSASNTLYAAHFTTTVLASAAFGPAHAIDTKEVFGGQGLSQGKDSSLSLHAGST